MLRLLLLLALMARLAPTPLLAGGGATHCAPIASATPGAEHLHHGDLHASHAPSTDEEATPDCSHCPPVECAQQSTCQVPAVVLAMVAAGSPSGESVVTLLAPRRASRWATTDISPPTRPPLTLLV